MKLSFVTIVAIFAVASFIFAVPSTWPASSQQISLDTFPRIDPEDLPEQYRVWLGEVNVILTTREREVFLRCENDAQRDHFIDGFWLVRDPTPGTPRNEAREQHYERLEYANFQFGRDTSRPGSQTDRGRVHQLLGKPMDINRLANTQAAYPAEIWFYNVDPRLGVPSYFYVAFYKYLGYGEYILYRPVGDGPMKLLNPAGVAQVRELTYGWQDMPAGAFGEMQAAYTVLREVDFELAHAAFSLIPGEGSLVSGMPSLASDVLLGDIQNIPNRLVPTAAWAYPVLTGIVEAEVRFETLPVTISAAAFIDPSGVPFIHYAAQTEGGRLNLNNYEDNYYLTFEVAGSLTDEQQNVVADIQGVAGRPKIIEQAIEGEENAREVRSGSFVFMDQLPTIDGSFRFDLVIENNVTNEFGHAQFDLSVPSVRPEQLSSSRPLLVRGFEYLDSYDPYSERLPFQLGRLSLFPAVDSTYSSNESLNVFHQVYLPPGGEDATRTSGGLRANYRLEFEGGFLRGKTSPIDLGDADPQGTINVITSLDLDGLAPGEYQLRVDVDNDDREPIYVPVHIKEPQGDREPPFVRAQQQIPATDPRIGYERALQYRVMGRTESALDTLGSALSREPDFKTGLDLQTELLMEAGRYEEVDRLLVLRQIENPNDEDLLIALARANAGLGRHYNAIRYYERARLVGGEETPDFLNALAAEYYADRQVARAHELLERSSELQPDQPEVRRLIDQVLALQDDIKEMLETFGNRVDLIMAGAEKDDQWKNLGTDDARRAFVTKFWAGRDPTPGTSDNEFREIYMRRVQTAAQRYPGSVPGYMTDRGKVYIIYGEPEEKAIRPATNTERQPVDTETDILWRYDAGKNSYLEQDEITFSPDTDGDYSLKSSLDLTASAFLAGQEVRDLIDAARPNLGPVGTRIVSAAATPDRTAMQRLLEEGVRQQDLALQQEFAFFPAPENNTFSVVAFEVGKAELTANSAANESTTTLRAFGLFLHKDPELGERPLRPFSIDFTITDDEGTEKESFTHSFGMPLPPGTYRLAWGVMDTSSGRLTTSSADFEVPSFSTGALMPSTIVASRAEPTMQTDVVDIEKIYSGIRVGNAHFDTDIDREFASTETIELLYFVTGAQPAPGTQQLRLEVTSRILRETDGENIGTFPAEIHDFFAIGQQIPLSELSELAAGGEYRIEIHIKDLVSGTEVVQTLPFRVITPRDMH
ncbi:MAG: hypothetical protein CL879_13320 [Dehalococcoidia bacterium]|nr:hypothetical protein [Dehalococcoidia bacterium]